jgi:Na+-driven multidrug efflux pump
MAGRRDTHAHRAVAIGGYAFAIIGLVGIIVAPHLAGVWAVMIGFGLAALPRAVIEWWRERRHRS